MTNHYEANPEGRSRSRVRVGVQEASGNLIFDGGLVNFFFFPAYSFLRLYKSFFSISLLLLLYNIRSLWSNYSISLCLGLWE